MVYYRSIIPGVVGTVNDIGRAGLGGECDDIGCFREVYFLPNSAANF